MDLFVIVDMLSGGDLIVNEISPIFRKTLIMLVFYGTKAVPIGTDEITMRCPSCEAHSPHDLMVSSWYFHLYHIPMSPYSKEAFIVCTTCGLKRSGLPFDGNLFSNYHEIKSKFRHPFYTYAGVAVIAGVFVAGAVVRVVNGGKL
jgi:hypothetical protein